MRRTVCVGLSLVCLTASWVLKGQGTATNAAPVNSTISVECFYALGENGLFAPSQPITLAMVLTNGDPAAVSLDLEVKIKDFLNKPVMQQVAQLNVEGNKRLRHQWDIPGLEKNGFYCVDVAVKKGGQLVGNAQCGFCVLPPAEKRDAHFGMDKNGLTKNLFKAFAMIGVGSVGIGPNWQVFYQDPASNIREKASKWIEPGTLIGDALASDFNVVGYAGIDTPKSKEITERRAKGLYPYPDSMFERFGETLEVFSELTRDRIKLWIIQQEIDARVGDPNAPAGSAACEVTSHVLLTRIGYNSLKKGNPNCEVAALGICCIDYTATPPFKLTRFILGDTKNHYDYLAIDAYSGNWNGCRGALSGPEVSNFRQLLLDATKLQKEFGKKPMVVNAERCYGIPYHQPFDHAQSVQLANYTARSLILNKSVPSVIYYSLHMGSYDGLAQRLKREKRISTDADPVLDIGLWKNEVDENGRTIYLPRSVVAAYATTARLLAFTTEPEELELRKGIYCYLFRKGEQSLAALWTIDQPLEVGMDLPTPTACWDLMGNKTELAAGKAQIGLSESPVFLAIQAEPGKSRESLEKMTFPALPKVKGEAHLESLSTVMLHLFNQVNRPVEVEVEVVPLKDVQVLSTNNKITLKPLARGKLPIEIKVTDASKLETAKLACRIKADGEVYEVAADLAFVPVAKARQAMTVDGDLSTYAGLPSTKLISPQDIYPRGAVIPERSLLTGDDDIGVTFHPAWDDKYLYLAARVTDDIHLQRQSGPLIWMDDCFQFAFDMRNDAVAPDLSGQKGYDDNDFNFGMALTAKGPECYCWVAGKDVAGARSFSMTIKREGKDTIYEIAIPWKELTPLPPKPGQAFGFSFIVMDSDRVEDPQAAYWIGLTEGIANGQDPSRYKTFVLMP